MTQFARSLGRTRSLIPLVLAIVAPSVAFAQRGMGRGGDNMGSVRNGLTRHEEIDVPKQVNAVNLLIEHRQDLALTDSQMARVVVIKRALDSTNTPLMRKMDSVQRLFKTAPLFTNESPARRDSVAQAKSLVRETVADLQDNLAAGREKAFDLLSSQQRDKADALAAAAQKTIDDEKAASEGRGRGAGPPRF